MGSIFRRIRGAVGNAAVWGLGWFGVGLAVLTGASAAGILPLVTTAGDVFRLASLIGAAGFATGGAFSLYIGIAYRNRELADIKPMRFALAGAAFAGAASIVVGGGIVTAALGGLIGFGTIKLAQHGAREVGSGGRDGIPALSSSSASQQTHQNEGVQH